jgi:uncharacterized protein YdeI (YjbR/CyaY-like superfamily)
MAKGVVAKAEPPILSFKDAKAFEKWLEKNFEDQTGLWLKLAKTGKGVPSITYPEAVEVALCFGWIDGLKRGFDETHWLQRFTPRRPRSMWSQINRDKAEQLVASGRMRASGQAEVERAKADGRWELAYAGQATAPVPAEIQADPELFEAFAKLNKVNRYAFTHRLHHAKRPETKAKLLQRLREGRPIYE